MLIFLFLLIVIANEIEACDQALADQVNSQKSTWEGKLLRLKIIIIK